MTLSLGSGSQSFRAVVVQPDGKIVAVGEASVGNGDFAVIRLNPDGSLDPDFGTGGVVTTDVGVDDRAAAVALQEDGRIVVAGSTCPEGFCSQTAVLRYSPGGRLDPEFSDDGVVLLNLGGLNDARAVAVDAAGRTVVAGGVHNPMLPGDWDELVLARYSPGGSLDAGFGTGGVVVSDLGGIDVAYALALQPDGKIVVAGTGGAPCPFMVARYDTAGRLDPDFGSGGVSGTDFGGIDAARALALQPDGRIVAAGVGHEQFVLLRLGPDGSPDPSLGGNGRVITRFPGAASGGATGLAIQANGRILAVGDAFSNGSSVFALARYTADGYPDASFGDCGLVTTRFGDSVLAEALGVALQPDGNAVLVGGAGACIPNCLLAAARYIGDPTGYAGQPPVARCRDVTVAADAECHAEASVDDGSFDPDPGDPIRLVQCPPGPYPLGQTRVTLAVLDSQDVSDVGSAVVTVIDVTPPSLVCPSNLSVAATSPAGAYVTYPAPTVWDNCGATVTCTPPSGSTFPVGDTLVACLAVDDSGNSETCCFTVHVGGPGEQIDDLVAQLDTLGIEPKLAGKLTAKLQKIRAAMAVGKTKTACRKLAAFAKSIARLGFSGKLTRNQAEAILSAVGEVGDALGCWSDE